MKITDCYAGGSVGWGDWLEDQSVHINGGRGLRRRGAGAVSGGGGSRCWIKTDVSNLREGRGSQ